MGLLSAAETTQIFEVFGIPENGTGVIITTLSHLPPALAETYEATHTITTMTNTLAQIDDRLEAVTATQLTRIQTLLTRWDEMGSVSPMKLTAAGTGEQGVIVDFEQERQNIRVTLGNIIGLFVPPNGFWGETQRILGSFYKGSNLGDRM